MRNLVLAAALAWPAAAAAQVTINAEVTTTELSAGEEIALSVTVAGPDANLPEPRIPALTSLSIYDSGRSQSLSIVNGQVSSSIVYTFVVTPRAVGKLVIPPISVNYKGRTVATAPIELNVRKADSAARSAPRPQPQGRREPEPQPQTRGTPGVFITAETDQKRAFVNEQLTLTVRFYTAINLLQSPQYQAPTAAGFLAEDLPPERKGAVQMHGRTYYYSEIKTALFPAQAGRLTIGPAVVKVAVPGAVDPFAPDFFDRFFQQGMGGRMAELRSDPLTIQADPLPEAGKPAAFSGAVGRYSISAAVDRARAKAGDAVTLTVTVTGEGNLKAVGDPVMPDLSSFRAFDTVSSLNLDKKNDLVHGSKVYKTVLVPRVSGALTIPPVKFSYFDPGARAYRSVETAAISIDVAPGDASAASAGPGLAAPRGVTAVSQDLRYLKTAARRGAVTRALEAAAAAGPLHALPLFVFLSAAGWSWNRRRLLADPARARARAALKTAQQRLREARAAEDGHAASARLTEALTGYLADKTGGTPSGLTLKSAIEAVRARRPDASAETLARLRQIWEELDRRRFAPAAGGADAAPLADALAALLERLDAEVFS